MTRSLERARTQYFSADVAQHILDLFAWRGYPAADILARVGLTREDLLHNGDDQLPVAVCADMLRAALDIAGDPQLLLNLSRDVVPLGFGMLGYVLQGCTTLEDGITTLMKYDRLISDLGETTLTHAPGRVHWGISIRLDDPLVVRHIGEFVMGARFRLLQLLDDDVANVLVEVHLPHAAPQDAAGQENYRKAFPCPVRFSQAECALVLQPAALKVPLRHYDAGLKRVIEVTADKKVSAMAATHSLREEVAAELRALLQNGEASRDRLAGRLGMSARSLARHLDAHGLSYRGLVDELRMEMARESLLFSATPVEEVGAALGFGDSVSFIRWFRKQTGMTPRAWREARPPE